MNFLSNLADSIPVVGHVKGVIHYAAGDTEGGNKAMYQATRTTAVLGAGAAGSIAGPGGAALAAMYAGTITDTVASVAMDKPQGIMKGCQNIADDIKEGKNPMGSIASTGFQLGMDGVGGLGMGGVSSAASQVSEKAVAKGVENIAKNAVASVGEKAIEKTVKMTGEQVVKTVTKKVTEKAVKKAIETAAVQAEIALVTVHVARQASERTKEEDEKERRDREEQAQRDREERERRQAREEQERRAREEQERRTREEQARRDREEQERRAREEQAQRAREEQERRVREEQAQRAREEQAQRAREQQEQRAREQQQQRAREQQQQRAREQQEQGGTAGINSESSQSPRDNQNNNNNNNNNKKSGKKKIDYFDIFMKLLEELLQLVFGDEITATRTNISQIFEGLSDRQINYLEKLIRILQKNKILKEVITLVIKIFSDHFSQDISFLNFISLSEFVAVYIGDEIDYHTAVYRGSEIIWRESDESIPEISSRDLRDTIIATVMNVPNIVQIIVDIFVNLRIRIESLIRAIDLSPNFRNIFSAVYHYFKHRYVPGGGLLSISEYYDWIQATLDRLDQEQQYIDLSEEFKESEDIEVTVIFQMYVVPFGRRIKVVVKIEDGKIILASCYVLNKTYADDEEGDVWIEIERF